MIKKIFYIFFILYFKRIKKNISFLDLNFRRLDFTNYKQIRSFVFKDNFIYFKNKYVQGFEFLNYSRNLGGKIGINISKSSIFQWFIINNNKINYPWVDDLTSKRLINIIYNYEYINSSSTPYERQMLNKIIFYHIERVIFENKNKKIADVTSSDLKAYTLSLFLLNKMDERKKTEIESRLVHQVDIFGMHRSYNILEHAKFINDLYEIKNIFLFFKSFTSKKFDQTVVKMTSSLNEYFHSDGSIPLFNGSNNIYTENIKNSLNKDVYLKSRNYPSNLNGIAYYKDKGRTLFFDVVQPNKDVISSNLNSGTLSFEFSGDGEKIISNCGASESFGKNPEYLRYSAAHSTIILQNTNISEINEKKSYIKFPQSVSFNSNSTEDEVIFESSHNGYLKKFKTIVKRKISINKNKNVINGEDTIISLKNIRDRIIYDIRFHLSDGFSFNFTNNKKNLILKSKFKKMWLFKCDSEIVVEDSILVDKNYTLPTNQIVIKGVLSTNKIEKKWSLEKI